MNLRRLWAGTGALAVVLFGCGLLFGDLLGSSNYPPLNASSLRLSLALALAGGITAAVFLLLSALTYRALAEPAVAGDPALAHALVVISYLAGGPGIAVPLALPVGAVAVTALQQGMSLPRWSAWLGVTAAVISLSSAGALLAPMNNSSALYGVLLLAAVLGFVWIFITSLFLAARA